jgi:capsular exopolysaccharide synthesis family protein
MYVFLLTKLEESRIIRASTTTDKRIIDIAYTPYKKQSPARVSTLLSAILAGFLLGILIVYAKRILDPRVQDEEEAKNITNLPIHGVIPDISTLGFTSSDIPVIKQIWKFPKGPAAEAFRTLKTNVEFSKTREHNIKVIQITSSEASEGKSTVISNLAIALAKGGNKVLLADLDLRRPTQHRIWSVPRSPGISDFLAGHKDLTTHKIDEFAVTVVTAGYDPPESQRLLSSDTLAKQILKWREDYDYVLLDTSPLLIADSLVISKLGDLMLFAVRPKKCKKSALKLAVNSYLKTDIIKGLIINGSATRKGGYYHYYRGSYYGEKTSDTQEQS